MAQLIQPRRSRRAGEIDLTPLVDVIFLLLIFFLVTSQFAQPTASLELPAGSPGAKPDETAIRVEVTSAGDLRVNGESIFDSAFEAAIERSMIGSPTRKIRFYGDHRIAYGRFVALLHRARLVGIDDFSIIKSQESPDEPASDR